MLKFPTHIVAVAGYVFNDAGHLLLVRTQHRGWDCTGGQVEAGESLEDAVRREIFEESGVDASAERLCGVYSNVGRHKFYDNVTDVPTKVMFDFICHYRSGVLTPSEETPEVQWAPRAQVMALVTAPALRYRFGKILGFDGAVTYASYETHPAFRLLSERQI